ncbi:MAG: thioredoxin family protein [Sphingomonadales bacterium]|nr:thioredoxin family protein [Sphingomonadales bacterium]
MRILSILALSMIGQPAAPSPPLQLVLFGATWCAPCRAELRALPALQQAAAPDRVVLAWIDQPPPLPAALATGIVQMPPAEAARQAHALLGEGYGLPAAVLLDGNNRPCAVLRAPLKPAMIAGLREACRAHMLG